MPVNKKCTWTLREKGKSDRNFLSEKDLDDYLRNNFISDIQKKSDIVFKKNTNVTNKTYSILSAANKEAAERLNTARGMAADAIRKREMNRVEDIENKFVDDTPAEAYADNF
jgi:hypothetical protein